MTLATGRVRRVAGYGEIVSQVACKPMLLIESGAQMTIELAAGQIGTRLLFKAVGPNDDPALAPVVALDVQGGSLRPPSPVHVSVRRGESGLTISWVRRSRIGTGWPDMIDVPLGESREAYRVALEFAGQRLERTVDRPVCTFEAAELTAALGAVPDSGVVEVAMLSDIVGPGAAARIPFST